jgi:hypothetical protein
MKRFEYSKLNPRQKENYNFQKVSWILANFGFSTIRLSDDWNGADFLAIHVDGRPVLRVQLKSRFYLSAKYERQNLWLCFPDDLGAYLLPYDAFFKKVAKKNPEIFQSKSWRKKNLYHRKPLSKELRVLLRPYLLTLAKPAV